MKKPEVSKAGHTRFLPAIIYQNENHDQKRLACPLYFHIYHIENTLYHNENLFK
ncbi:hypothetical protein CBFG_01007 [Clostridiales bacterium 1_7_47FAA]|nr:hypothetical protein CBFG_01007 [Clostridiales bacterium 1_7_47FAA]